MMKDFKQLYNKLVVFNVVLLLAVVALFVLVFTKGSGKKSDKEEATTTVTTSRDTVTSVVSERIAVVKLEKLLLEYKLANDLNEELLEKQKNAEAKFQAKMTKFERDYTQFQEKVRLGSFLSQSSMEAQQQDLMTQQAKLQELQESLTIQLAQDQELMNQRLYDSVVNNIELINHNRFDLIMGDAVGTNVLYSNRMMDITDEVLEFLNSRYVSPNDEK